MKTKELPLIDGIGCLVDFVTHHELVDHVYEDQMYELEDDFNHWLADGDIYCNGAGESDLGIVEQYIMEFEPDWLSIIEVEWNMPLEDLECSIKNVMEDIKQGRVKLRL